MVVFVRYGFELFGVILEEDILLVKVCFGA